MCCCGAYLIPDEYNHRKDLCGWASSDQLSVREQREWEPAMMSKTFVWLETRSIHGSRPCVCASLQMVVSYLAKVLMLCVYNYTADSSLPVVFSSQTATGASPPPPPRLKLCQLWFSRSLEKPAISFGIWPSSVGLSVTKSVSNHIWIFSYIWDAKKGFREKRREEQWKQTAAIVKCAEKARVWTSRADREKPVTVPRLWWHSHITESSSSTAHNMS